MPSWVDKAQNWAQKTQVYAVVFAAVVCTVCAGIAFIFLISDVQTSYRGFGRLMETHIRSGDQGVAMAWAVSLVPTLFQTLWWLAATSGMSFITNHSIFVLATAFMAVADTGLDTYELYDPALGMSSLVLALVTAVGVFGLLSEFLLSFMAPIAIVLWEVAAGKMAVFSEESSGGGIGASLGSKFSPSAGIKPPSPKKPPLTRKV